MTLFLTFYFPQTNRMLLGHCCMYFCLYLFLWNIIIIEKKKKMGELEHMVCESPCCDSLFSVKLHVSTINGSDGVDEGVYFYLHTVIFCF